jgi:murein L,D-transpeptidase YcbB/YkuD
MKADSVLQEYYQDPDGVGRGMDWKAIGELDIAIEHVILMWPNLARDTRTARKNFESLRKTGFKPDLIALVNQATDIEEELEKKNAPTETKEFKRAWKFVEETRSSIAETGYKKGRAPKRSRPKTVHLRTPR